MSRSRLLIPALSVCGGHAPSRDTRPSTATQSPRLAIDRSARVQADRGHVIEKIQYLNRESGGCAAGCACLHGSPSSVSTHQPVRSSCVQAITSDAKPKRAGQGPRESLGSRHGQDPPVRRSCWSRDGSTLKPVRLWEYRNRHRSLASAWRRLAPCRSRSGSLRPQNYSPTAFQNRGRTLDALAGGDLTNKLRREGVDRHWLKL
jgi:hypothetical protein